MTTMTEQDHLERCVKFLAEALQEKNWSDTPEMLNGYQAVFELIDQPWEDLPGDMKLWRDGYEQCMRDIVDAIADEWDVELPEEG